MIIGITGTNGAGKTTVVEILKHNDFQHFSVREFLIEEIRRRKLPVNRTSMQSVANDLRVRNGPDYIVKTLYEKAKGIERSSVIESIRAIPEVESLKNNGDFFLISVDAEIDIRYKRITGRGSESDNIGFETFVDQEKRELENTNPAHQNIKACMESADFHIDNSGTYDQLENKVKSVLFDISRELDKREKSIW